MALRAIKIHSLYAYINISYLCYHASSPVDIVVLPFQEFDVNLPVVELHRSSDVSSRVFIGDGKSVIGIIIGDTEFTEAHVSHEEKIIMWP